MKKILAAFAALVVMTLGVGSANASSTQYQYVAWKLSPTSTSTQPFNAPQTQPKVVYSFHWTPSCGTGTYQLDRYIKNKDEQALVASGHLDGSSQDSYLLRKNGSGVSYVIVSAVPCETSTPSATPTVTPSTTPTPGCSNPPLGNAECHTSGTPTYVKPSVSPTPTPSLTVTTTSVAAPTPSASHSVRRNLVVVNPPVNPKTSRPVYTPPKPKPLAVKNTAALASTGSSSNLDLGLGAALVLVGAGIMFLAKPGTRKH